MPKQVFDVIDYFGVVAVAISFAIIIFCISFFVLNWCFIWRMDDITVFEKLGHKFNVRLGPHTLDEVNRCGIHKTFPDDQERLVYDHA